MPSTLSNSRLRVLFVTPEVYPLIKTGGLGDVSAALPAALSELQVDIRLIIPGYPQVLSGLKYKRKLAKFDALSQFPPSTLLSAKLHLKNNLQVPIFVIDCPGLYQREGSPYLDAQKQDWPDNGLRFGLLSKIGSILASDASPIAWRPQLVHCNDWPSGLVPAYLNFHSGEKAASLMTIHNLAFQGIFPPGSVAQLGLPASSFNIFGLEYYGSMSFLKAGIFYCDHISTVSPGYAKEIQSEPLGFGLQGLLASRSKNITGITNGIDTTEWDPVNDPIIPRTYSSKRLSAKAINKEALQLAMDLNVNPEIPLFGVVNRLSHQKGCDILLQAAPELMKIPAQIAVLGSGESQLEVQLTTLGKIYPGKIAAHIGFNEKLSHLIEAGSDGFLMPSRFEPCGLNQMYSQRYGTPPVVHATGGLNDTVVNYTPATLTDGSASGFLFNDMTAESFIKTIQQVVAVYNNKKIWQRLQRNCMKKDFSWKTSASAYQKIYSSLLT